MGDKIRFQLSLEKSNSDIFVNPTPRKMNKLAALSALVLLAQLINASPVAETSEAERALDSLTFVSKSGPERQDRERRAAAARSGLKCYNQEGSSRRIELECDLLSRSCLSGPDLETKVKESRALSASLVSATGLALMSWAKSTNADNAANLFIFLGFRLTKMSEFD